MFQEQTHKPHKPISSRLTLLDWQYPQNTSRNLCIEFFLVKVLLRSLLLRLGGLVAAYFLDLPQANDQLPGAICCTIGFGEDGADGFAQ